VVAFVEMHLVNDPFGDPALLVDFRSDRRAMLFDMGELHAIPARKLLRVSHVFVSHAHLDHVIGFDHLLRFCLGRPNALSLIGPPGLMDRIGGRLAGYSWNLLKQRTTDFVIVVEEFDGRSLTSAAAFHSCEAFSREAVAPSALPPGVVLDEERFTVHCALLDHGIPSLAFAFREKPRLNVWKDRLDGMGLAVGPWLTHARRAMLRGDPDDALIAARNGEGTTTHVPLGVLKAEAFRPAPGVSFAYIADVAYHQMNAARIIDLARGIGTLFIEAMFADEDSAIAAARRHLTAGQAGLLARQAQVRQVVPFHHSPRYRGQQERLRWQLLAAFGDCP
jgi:ribonuclease Z